MAIRLVSYLKRNRLGYYYFRRVIPFDLRRFFAFREFERSTGTATRREATVLAPLHQDPYELFKTVPAGSRVAERKCAGALLEQVLRFAPASSKWIELAESRSVK